MMEQETVKTLWRDLQDYEAQVLGAWKDGLWTTCALSIDGYDATAAKLAAYLRELYPGRQDACLMAQAVDSFQRAACWMAVAVMAAKGDKDGGFTRAVFRRAAVRQNREGIRLLQEAAAHAGPEADEVSEILCSLPDYGKVEL